MQHTKLIKILFIGNNKGTVIDKRLIIISLFFNCMTCFDNRNRPIFALYKVGYTLRL